jgi:hypothetical protein
MKATRGREGQRSRNQYNISGNGVTVIINIFYLFSPLFDSSQSAGSWSDSPNPCLSQQSPVLSVVSFSEICLDTHIFFDRSIHGSPLPPHRGLEHGKARHGLVDVKLQPLRAPICPKSSKATVPLSDYPNTTNQSRWACPFRRPQPQS